jgi:hypothetical protein
MRRLVIALVAAAACGGAARVAADPAGPRVELAQIGGATSFGDTHVEGRAVENGPYLGLRLAVPVHRLWSLEAAGGDSPTSEAGVDDRQADLFHISGNLVCTPWACAAVPSCSWAVACRGSSHRTAAVPSRRRRSRQRGAGLKL